MVGLRKENMSRKKRTYGHPTSQSSQSGSRPTPHKMNFGRARLSPSYLNDKLFGDFHLLEELLIFCRCFRKVVQKMLFLWHRGGQSISDLCPNYNANTWTIHHPQSIESANLLMLITQYCLELLAVIVFWYKWVRFHWRLEGDSI